MSSPQSSKLAVVHLTRSLKHDHGGTAMAFELSAWAAYRGATGPAGIAPTVAARAEQRYGCSSALLQILPKLRDLGYEGFLFSTDPPNSRPLSTLDMSEYQTEETAHVPN